MSYDPKYHADYYQRHKERWRARDLVRIGWTVEQYEAARVAQNYSCAICGRPEDECRDGRLQCDHCHVSGERRALLCLQCNTALGLMADDPGRLRAAADYLVGS